MKKINILYCVLCVILMSSCYEDYTKDYNYSTAYFASQKPLRTVIPIEICKSEWEWLLEGRER